MRTLSLLLIGSIFMFAVALTYAHGDLFVDNRKYEAIVSNDATLGGILVIDYNLTYDDCRAYGRHVLCLEQEQ